MFCGQDGVMGMDVANMRQTFRKTEKARRAARAVCALAIIKVK